MADYEGDLGKAVIAPTAAEKPVPVLMSFKGADRECLVLSTSPEFLRIIARARQEIQRGETLSFEETEREVQQEPLPGAAQQRWRPCPGKRNRRRKAHGS